MPTESALLGTHASVVMETADALQRHDVIGRIWRRDHTVWRQDPTEITDRLGWLTLTDAMRRELPLLQRLVAEVQAEGIRHVVLLAMGGSALAPEVYRATFPSRPDFPTFLMLDSTVPGWVESVAASVDPAKTLFIVASKSGGTTEVLSFYRYFRAQVEERVEAHAAGRHFIAITDEGTALAQLGEQESFRCSFLNPSDVGGRFSGLSLFGLVPAALMGIDLETFLDGVDAMRERCGPSVPVTENPGAWLGTVMGSLAKQGMDKLTLITSPALASFGLWAEQMLAESLGKEGTGIVPIVHEPLIAAEAYGHDRLFVYLRLPGDENAITDAHVELLQAAGRPTLCLEMEQPNDLGGELFRWAFATSVAGHILGVHPFDQPNVQRAKDLTAEELSAYQQIGSLPSLDVSDSAEALLAQAAPGDYLALLAYLAQSPQVDEQLAQIRHAVQERYHMATTAGYGPRYLHSTGQLHKGGANQGLFLQLVGQPDNDLPIPGQPYTFGTLAKAQAQGDIRALQVMGRRVARYRLGPDPVGGLKALANSIAANDSSH